MNSLNGRSLETLARLGGCSVLTLPADFAPASMRLPSCIVATISYLRTHGKSTPTFDYIGQVWLMRM